MIVEIDVHDEECKIEENKCLQLERGYGDRFVAITIKYDRTKNSHYERLKVSMDDLKKAINALCL